MRARPTLAVVAAFAIAACDNPPTGSKPQPEGPLEPMAAMAASTGCSSRCGYVINVTGSGRRSVQRVTEDARVLGFYWDTDHHATGTFSWSRTRGTSSTVFRFPAGEQYPWAYARNSWGQTVGTTGFMATAWEPDGTPVALRDPATGRRIRGYGTAINENSVIVGNGLLEGAPAPNPERPFRWHYREGFTFLIPDNLEGRAADVNGAGTVVGGYIRAGSRGSNATWFIWTPAGGRRDLGSGEALGISENGHVIGTGNYGEPWLYTPAGETIMLPRGWMPVDVNDWGEVLLGAMNPEVVPPGTCGAAVWYKGYGLRPLTSPVADSPTCTATSINSWGDVGGTVVRPVAGSSQGVHTPVVWTWKNNAYRYVSQ